MRHHAAAAFAGTWHLLPEQCDYQLGHPPRSGHYRLACTEDGMLSISSEWFGKNGKRHRAAFGGRADGVPYPFHDTPHADALSFESVSPTLLHSTTWHEGREVQWSERELVDGDTLVIRMRGHLSDGRSYTNVGVFRRQAD